MTADRLMKSDGTDWGYLQPQTKPRDQKETSDLDCKKISVQDISAR